MRRFRYVPLAGFQGKVNGMNGASVPNERDRAIDILRGFALITITINHLTGFAFKKGALGMAFPTLSHWGFSSAAEIFFLVSGYLVGAVYLRAGRDDRLDRFAGRMFARAGRLYVYNALLFLMIVPICWLSPQLARLSFFSHFINGGPIAWASFAAMYLQPYCLEILAVYTLFMLTAPIFAWGLLRNPIFALALSLLLYICAYHFYWLKLPGGTPGGDWRWNFSPASWQFLFFGAMAAGRYRLADRMKALFLADWRWFAAAALLFAVLTAIFVAQTALAPLGLDFWVWGQSKVRVGPIRILHALSVCWVVLGALWLWPGFQNGWVGRQAALIGSRSLQCFVASVVISYVAGLIWVEFAPTYRGYIMLCMISVIALGVFARLYDLAKQRPTMELRPASATA